MRQHCAPVLVLDDPSNTRHLVSSVRASSTSERGYDEAFVQDLILNHPDLLPLGEIEPGLSLPIALCDELPTPAGPLDAVFITREGVPILAECKLWKNPQARREVVGQILDYAKEIRTWSYEDLQRAVAQRVRTPRYSLFGAVAECAADPIDETDFIDSVTTNLRRGRFILLVVGDGIRADAEAIGEYLAGSGSLEYTFAMVELPVFDLPTGGRLVVPRIIARTTVIDRVVVSLQSDGIVISQGPEEEAATDLDPDVSAREQQIKDENLALWSATLEALELDDAGQDVPKASSRPNLFFNLPVERDGRVLRDSNWITVYLSRSSRTAGLFVTGTNASHGGAIMEILAQSPSDIQEHLGEAVRINRRPDGKINIGESWPVDGFSDPAKRQELAARLASRANDYVNYFRPRVASANRQLEAS